MNTLDVDLVRLARRVRRRHEQERERATIVCPDCDSGTLQRAAGTWCPRCRRWIELRVVADGLLVFVTIGAPL